MAEASGPGRCFVVTSVPRPGRLACREGRLFPRSATRARSDELETLVADLCPRLPAASTECCSQHKRDGRDRHAPHLVRSGGTPACPNEARSGGAVGQAELRSSWNWWRASCTPPTNRPITSRPAHIPLQAPPRNPQFVRACVRAFVVARRVVSPDSSDAQQAPVTLPAGPTAPRSKVRLVTIRAPATRGTQHSRSHRARCRNGLPATASGSAGSG